jgi:hypothetical protein
LLLDETNYATLNDEQRHILVQNLEEDFEAGGPNYDEVVANLARVGLDISREEYDNLVYEITDEGGTSPLDKYLKVYPDNELMVETLKKNPVKGILIYKLRLPLGKSFVIQHDRFYGEYPVLVDKQ